MALPSSSGGSISIGQIWAETGAPANPNEDINTVKNIIKKSIQSKMNIFNIIYISILKAE